LYTFWPNSTSVPVALLYLKKLNVSSSTLLIILSNKKIIKHVYVPKTVTRLVLKF